MSDPTSTDLWGDGSEPDSSKSGYGTSQSPPPNAWGSNEPAESGYGGSGYDDAAAPDTNTGLGAGSNPYSTDLLSNGYQENPYEVNPGDSPYTETLANPNPKLRAYRPTEVDYGNDDQLVL